MTEMVDCPHPQPLSRIGRGEKNVDRENIKIGFLKIYRSTKTRQSFNEDFDVVRASCSLLPMS
ncbi:hypothetical protein [Hydrococcus rivularis]|uniref:hypothetical protein n=1 Tax=Hydrococcus rivularis TaxID=1616834 RepID=UPI00111477FF|nr:hypothetical protein [Hydrococcus rivularis]